MYQYGVMQFFTEFLSFNYLKLCLCETILQIIDSSFQFFILCHCLDGCQVSSLEKEQRCHKLENKNPDFIL